MGLPAEDAEVLLVEDDRDEAELALSALRRSGYADKVATAADGEEALHYLFGSGPFAGRKPGAEGLRLVLLDLKLPKVDGLEVLRRLKSDARTRTIPVVVLTSSQEERDIRESYGLGVNSYAVKPVAFDKFVEDVARLSYYWLTLNRLPG